MAMLQGLVLEVTLIIVLTTIFDLMLPEGRLQPFVRLIMSLFVLVSLLNPLLSLVMPQEEIISAWTMKQPVKQTNWDSIAVQGAVLQQELEQEVKQQYKEKLEQQIKALLTAVGASEISELEVKLSEDGQILQGISFRCTGLENKEEEYRYRELLAAYYGLNENCVQIKQAGG